MIKKLKFILEHVDGVWSIPLFFVLFWLVGVVVQSVFGYTTGVYDMAFVQPLFLAATISIGASNLALFALYFNFRGLYRFLYGQKDANGNWLNASKETWKNLTAWQKFLISMFVYFFYAAATITVYLKLV